MTGLMQIAQQLKYGGTYERVLACQRLMGLDKSAPSGDEVSIGASTTTVPRLVTDRSRTPVLAMV